MIEPKLFIVDMCVILYILCWDTIQVRILVFDNKRVPMPLSAAMKTNLHYALPRATQKSACITEIFETCKRRILHIVY